MTEVPMELSTAAARRIWLHAQRLDERAPLGAGPEAVRRAVEHLGYVQIDTINVIERSHHHILFSRIPDYRRADLRVAQSDAKTVFEYWTHALSYVPTRDLPFFLGAMAAHKKAPGRWFADVAAKDAMRLVRQIAAEGPLSIRDLDEEPVEKDHPWASRKPSKRALELGFYNGDLTVSGRDGMVKSYELMARHFGWTERPRAATAGQVADYLLARAMRSQGLISASSVMYPRLRFSAEIAKRVAALEKRKALVPVSLEGSDEPHWVDAEAVGAREADPALVHVLSPFDPLIIQRNRLAAIFGYAHVFEAYLPQAKRRFGYFTLPVLVGARIAAALDLKADRAAGKLLIQAWHWLPEGRRGTDKALIEAELERFARFQFGG